MEPLSNNQYAIQLIRVNEDGKYILTQQGAQFISKIPAPIAVVSVAGMYRTGKSYLLNRMLLNRCNGFGVGPTVNPCTKGLWCWSKTVSGKTNEGESVNVIIIDTQGIGALDEDQTHDTRIFTLAILSASSFIYNSTGSIDENALQNLSLVVNLTKNIQLNSLETQEQQDDPQMLAEYFPSFYWVVRDFALQLQTADGDPISPKQYLERALAPQKGFSDDVQEKNRIRRLLSAFFKQRQCFTMVRPLVDENKLQHLDKLQLDELRPEFVEQAMNFRRRVLNKIKPKLLHGKCLDGQMYLCLMNSYVSAINNGAVPNIQNAWNYMCQQQCAKAFEESLNTFNQEFSANIKSHLPIQQQYLIDYLTELKQKCCEQFEHKAIGDQIKFHTKQLHNKFQHKISLIRADNQKQSETILKNYFKKNIIDIENKLKIREYKKFEQFTKDINQFYQRILENGPNLPKKQLIYLQLIKRVVPMAAQIFLKQKSQQFQKYKQISVQKQQTLLKIQQCLKKQLQQQTAKANEKITALDRSIIQLQLSVDDYKNKTESLQQQLTQKQSKYIKQKKQIEDSYEKQSSKYEQKIDRLANNIEELETKLSSIKYEEQKNSAVFQMKIKQLQQNLEEARKKESTLQLNIKTQQLAATQQNKQLSQKFQYQLKAKQLQINSLNNTLSQLQDQKTSSTAQMCQKITELQQQLQRVRNQSSRKQTNLLKQIHQLQQSYNCQTINQTENLKTLTEDLQKYRNKYCILEKQLQKNSEQSIQKQNKYKTDIAVLEQKMGFLETQNKQYQEQLVNIKKMYQDLVDEDQTRKQQQQQLLQTTKITELTDTYQLTIRQLKNQHEIILKKISTELQQTTKTLNEKTLQNKLLKSSTDNLLAQKTHQSETFDQKYKQFTQQAQKQLSQLKQQLENKQKYYQNKIQEISEQLQALTEQRNREREEMVSKTQIGLKQVKNFYQLEKQRAENKLVTEKEKYQRKIAMIKQQYEDKIKDQVSQLQQQNQRLRSDMMEMQEQFNKQLNNRKIQYDIKNKNHQLLERANQELKSKLQHKQSELLSRLDKQQKDNKLQKQTLHNKIQQLLTAQSRLQKQKINLTHNKDTIDKLVLQKQADLKQMKQQLTQVRSKIQKQRQQYKNWKNQINMKRNQERVQLEKKVALLEQQNLYIKKKLEDNEKSYGSEQQNNQEKIKKIKEQYSMELKSERQKNIQEYETLQKKYDKLKKSAKQTQSTLNKTISQLQKQLAISSQRLSNATEKLSSFQQKLGQQSQQYLSQISTLKSNHYKQKQDLKQQLDRQIQDKQKIESEKNSVQALYQQDKILWENRIKFLQENKQKVKNQYETSKSQLEAIIDKNRKKHTTEKMSIETAHSQKIVKLQKKYWTQKQQLTQNYKKQEADFQSKIKTLEYQLRSLQEKTAFDEQNKQGQIHVSEKRMKQMIENQKKLQVQVQRLRNLRQKQNKQQQEIFQKEKADLRQKNLDKDQKLKTSEKQRQHLFYEIQKERAKWGIERDTIMNKIDQQKDVINKNQRDIERLQRQNQKLKVQKKCHKSNLNSMNRYGGSFGYGQKAGSSRSSFQDSVILKENSNNSQMSDTSIFFKE